MSHAMTGSLVRSICLSSVAVIGLTALSACGGGGGGSTAQPPVTQVPPPPPPPPPPTGTSFSLAGEVAKGLIFDGTVEVLDPEDGRILATSQTSGTDGTFDITVPDTANFERGIAILRVSGDADATMLCDAGDGCGDVDFGERVSIGPDFVLETFVDVLPTTDFDVNVNVLTTMVVRALQIPDPALSTDDILAAQDEVMTSLGFAFADPSTLSVSGTSSEEIRLAAISGGLLSAFSENGYTLAEGLAWVLDRAASGFLVNESPATNTITYEEILEGAVASARAADPDTPEVEAVLAELLLELQQASTAEPGSNTLTNAFKRSNLQSGTPLQQSKLFVEDLQKVVAAVESETNSDNLDAFGDRLEMAYDLVSDDMEGAVDIVSDTVDRLATDYENNREAIESGGLAGGAFSDGFAYEISFANGVATYTVALDDYRGFDTQLTVAFAYEDDIYSDRASEFDIAGTAEISGVVQNDAVALTIDRGSVEADEGRFIDVVMPGTATTIDDETRTISVDAERLSLKLEARLADKSPNGLALDGELTATVTDLGLKRDSRYVDAFYDVDFETETAAFGVELSFVGRGEFEAKSFDIALGVFSEDEGVTFEATNVVAGPTLTKFVSAPGNSIRLEAPFGNDVVWSLLDVDAANTQIAEAEAVGGSTQNSDGSVTVVSPNGDILIYVPPKTEAAVAKFEVVNDFSGDNTFKFFAQQADIGTLFSSADPDAVLEGDTVEEFLNKVLRYETSSFFTCVDDDERFESNLYLEEDFTAEVGREVPSIFVGRFSQTCEEVRDFQGVKFSPDNTASDIEGLSLQALVAASVSQDIIGIDPEDPRVTFSAFGPVEITGGEVTDGEFTFVLDYAGRLFRTNARSFDIFEDLTVPVIVTNQNDVVLTISEAEDGTITGDIRKKGTVYGTIQDSNGVVRVEFTDGVFVTLR